MRRAFALLGLCLAACSGGPEESSTPPPPPGGGEQLCERERLTLEPAGISFGRLAVETERRLEATLSYEGCKPATPELELTRVSDTCAGDEPFCMNTPLPGEMAPGDRVQIGITFRADQIGGVVGGIGASGCPTRRCESELLLQARGEETGIVCFPGLLDFGAVASGQCSFDEITCTNVVDRNASLDAIEITHPEIAATTELPMMLPPDASTTIEASYCPTDDGPDDAALDVTTTVDDLTRTMSLELTGRSGGGVLGVPAAVDFGEVSLIAPARRAFNVSNDGSLPIDVVDVVTDGEFSSVLQSGASLQPGESATLWITAEPVVEGIIEDTATLYTDDPANPTYEVTLRAEGVNLPPCRARVPRELNFGAVDLLAPATELVTIENTGTTECLLTGAFAVPSIGPFRISDLTSVRFGPGTTATVPVKFTPTSTVTEVSAELEIGISDPRGPFTRLRLIGRGR